MEDLPWISLSNIISALLTAAFAFISIHYARQGRELQQAFDTIDLAKKAGGFGVWTYDPGEGTAYWDDPNKQLGLSMVEGFARQSGGFVKIYSELGVGTSVKMFFPVAAEHETGKPEPAKPEEPELIGHARILVAEDEIEVLGLVVRALMGAGYDVDAAGSGDDAFVQFCAGQQYDLLITDIVMPGKLNGPDLARACREIKDDLPVIFMSGYASEATVHGNGLRVSDVRLMKPVPKSELLSAVRSSLDDVVLR